MVLVVCFMLFVGVLFVELCLLVKACYALVGVRCVLLVVCFWCYVLLVGIGFVFVRCVFRVERCPVLLKMCCVLFSCFGVCCFVFVV